MEQTAQRSVDIDLADRNSDGFNVILWLEAGTNRPYVTVDDIKNNEMHLVEVPSPDLAMEVYNHPFSYIGEVALKAA